MNEPIIFTLVHIHCAKCQKYIYFVPNLTTYMADMKAICHFLWDQ